jgi:hypothetical protein
MSVSAISGPWATPDANLNAVCEQVAKAALIRYKEKGLKAENLSFTIASLGDANTFGSYRGTAPQYPASVVKTFYLVHGAHEIEQKKLKLTPEVERGFREMIQVSDNDATAFVLDLLTDTTSGSELSGKALETWTHKRKETNRFFEARQYEGVNACQKTWSFGPYGRDKQSYGPKNENRNSLTSENTARLFAEIAQGEIVGKWGTEWCLKILERVVPANSATEDGQAKKIGGALPKGSKLWAKSGWTSVSQHDAAYFQLPDGSQWTLAIYTQGIPNERTVLPFITEQLLKAVTSGR